ncbi:xylose operon transcription regulator XylR [Kiritimatiella glycovorans]|uniref:AraC family transcriptional regulator n=1 Tax=Kiritimatiella glycovorans TaxID=1307763 RepID=A0A0G3EK32_9BACT|nr:DNA-binding transcriptional regulator [Kiritimatiella glycovorans]AKJ65155.1 AraC family transcriptional regulator [Kiritimatiella glycovorans]
MDRLIRHRRVLLVMGERYNMRVHRGVAQYASGNRWHLTNLFGTDPGPIRRRGCDGIVAVLDPDDPLTGAVLRRRVPKVDLSIIRDRLAMPHLTGDNEAMGREAALHFLDRGFRSFLWFSARDHAPARKRCEGYTAELARHGFNCRRLVVDAQFGTRTPPWEKLEAWIHDELAVAALPCAAYVYNDVQAADLLDACVSGGIQVPHEVAVLGTDNHPLICPTAAVPLSSINHDLEELGRRAAAELDRLMSGEPSARRIITIPHRGITVRQSSDIFAINDPCMVRALRYLHANFHRDLSVEDIVEASGTSRRSLQRCFKARLNQTIHGELMRLRVNRVCQLLRETSYSVSDIAAVSGFNTPEYLHRIFRQRFGMTPRQYRMKEKERS